LCSFSTALDCSGVTINFFNSSAEYIVSRSLDFSRESEKLVNSSSGRICSMISNCFRAVIILISVERMNSYDCVIYTLTIHI